MTKWAIKAVFCNEAGEKNFTYYQEKTYRTERGALKAINSAYGDEIAQAANLDCEIEEDLKGFWLDDLDIYQVKESNK